jgi:hypothetical protein
MSHEEKKKKKSVTPKNIIYFGEDLNLPVLSSSQNRSIVSYSPSPRSPVLRDLHIDVVSSVDSTNLGKKSSSPKRSGKIGKLISSIEENETIEKHFRYEIDQLRGELDFYTLAIEDEGIDVFERSQMENTIDKLITDIGSNQDRIDEIRERNDLNKLKLKEMTNKAEGGPKMLDVVERRDASALLRSWFSPKSKSSEGPPHVSKRELKIMAIFPVGIFPDTDRKILSFPVDYTVEKLNRTVSSKVKNETKKEINLSVSSTASGESKVNGNLLMSEVYENKSVVYLKNNM